MPKRFFLCVGFFSLLLFSSVVAVEPVGYFTSEVDLSKKFIEYVCSENVSIRFASHRLSDVEVIRSLVEAHRRGVSVEVLVDSVSVTTKTPLKLLEDSGIKVFVWKGLEVEKKGPKKHMHHTFCVFGQSKLWTGSYSFSLKRLFAHEENAIVLENKKVASDFLKEFQKMVNRESVPFVFSSIHKEDKKGFCSEKNF